MPVTLRIEATMFLFDSIRSVTGMRYGCVQPSGSSLRIEATMFLFDSRPIGSRKAGGPGRRSKTTYWVDGLSHSEEDVSMVLANSAERIRPWGRTGGKLCV